MRNFSLFLILCMAISSHLFGQTAVVVDATISTWQSTGIIITSGAKVLLIGKGTYSNGGGTDRTDTWCSPDGNATMDSVWISQDYLVNTANPLSLVGKIGTNGKPFGIGSYRNIEAPQTGELFLGINDNTYSDNYGYLVAIVFYTSGPSNSVGQMNNGRTLSSPMLRQNYPNPFNPATTINYEVPKASNVQIKVYDIDGKLVKTLINRFVTSGDYFVSWNGTTDSGSYVSSGTYFYQIQVGDFVQAKKMVLLK